MSGFKDKQRTLVNTVGVPGVAGSSPGESRGGMSKCGPTTKLIILRRSPKTSLWVSCGLNLHTNTVYCIHYGGKWEGVGHWKSRLFKIVYFTATDGSESVDLLRELRGTLCTPQSELSLHEPTTRSPLKCKVQIRHNPHSSLLLSG
jgi:hypothetical protein